MGSAWTTTSAGSGAGTVETDETTSANTRLPVADTVTDGRRTDTVGEHDRLPHPKPAHGDGVVRLVPLHRDLGPGGDAGQGRHEMDGQGHQCALNASRSRPKTDFALGFT